MTLFASQEMPIKVGTSSKTPQKSPSKEALFTNKFNNLAVYSKFVALPQLYSFDYATMSQSKESL